MSADSDSDRSRRLLFAPELAAGTITRADLARAPVREAARSRRVPSRLSRAYQRRLMRRGDLGYESETVERAMTARRAVLGDAAHGPPRLLVRLAATPGGVASEPARRAHAVLAEANVAPLVAVAAEPLDAAADEQLAVLRRADVAFAMHGLGDGEPPLRKLKRDALAARVDAAEQRLAEHAVAPEVLVATEPFGQAQWDRLAERFLVIAAGAGAVRWMGFHDTPLWRGEAVWMPSYPPFDGPAGTAAEGARRLADRGAALWVPVTIDPTREAADDFAGLRAFAAAAASLAVSWPDFLDAVRASR